MDKELQKDQDRKVELLHLECQNWKSGLQFMEDELLFIERLLNSYVFEPNTPNLFERLSDYQQRLIKTRVDKKEAVGQIARHRKDLGGMLECTDSECDLTYYLKHEKLKAKVLSCQQDFRHLKTEIFNYAGGILKKRKPG